MNLIEMGFNSFFEKQWKEYDKQEHIPGRIALEHKRLYRVWTEVGELLCEVSGKLSFEASSREDFPAVGDWVMISPRVNESKGTIHKLLNRQSKFSRKAAGDTTEEQIVAANVDTIFLVNSLNQDLNLRRIERYLLLTWESGAKPVIVLSKSDLCPNVEEAVQEVESIAYGVPIVCISSVLGEGIEQLKEFVSEGQTIALLGSSGVGKSTLANTLIGYEHLLTNDIRSDDDKGRHTTTHREMVLLTDGGILIDTPGMRELQLWEADSGLSESFQDIETLSEDCFYRDCKHENEPNCAIHNAIQSGKLAKERFDSYKKLLRELQYLDRKQDKRAMVEEKKKWKSINKAVKHKKR